MLNNLSLARFLVVASAGLFAIPVGAELSEEARTRISALEFRIHELEQRILELEEQFTEAVENLEERQTSLEEQEIAEASPFAVVREEEKPDADPADPLWQQIQLGMTVEEVEEILGRPDRHLDALRPRVDLVYYYGDYQVRFHRGKVVGLRPEPQR